MTTSISKNVARMGVLITVMASCNAFSQATDRTIDQELRSLGNRFERVDVNRDGKLDAAERLTEMQRIATRDNRAVGSGTGGAFGTNNDSNSDGLITLAEAQIYVRAQFARLDTNRDGKVTESERQATKAPPKT